MLLCRHPLIHAVRATIHVTQFMIRIDLNPRSLSIQRKCVVCNALSDARHTTPWRRPYGKCYRWLFSNDLTPTPARPRTLDRYDRQSESCS